MDILNSVVFGNDEIGIASDLFSGRLKVLVLPYFFQQSDVNELLLVAIGDRPGVATAKAEEVYYDSLGDLRSNIEPNGIAAYRGMLEKEMSEDPDKDRIFTVVRLGEVRPVPMDFESVQNDRYNRGDLLEEEDTDGMSTEHLIGC